MGRVASVGKIEEWVRRLARYEASNETVARFCQREGVSVPSFYAWKKKLAQAPASRVGASPRFLPVQIAAVVQQLLRAAGDAQPAEDHAC